MPRIRRSTAFLLALIVLVSAGLRLIELETAPWGGHGDVAWIGINALDWIDNGVFPYYIYELYAPEPMIVQVVAILQTFLGPSFFTSRLATMIFGLLLVLFLFPATWWLIGETVESQQRERASLLASLAGAMSIHAMYISHLGMRAALFPALLALVVWLTVWAWRTGGWWRWAFAGASLALMQYNYIPARLVPLILMLWFAHDFIFNREHWRQSIRGWVIMAATSFLLTLPNIITFVLTPEAFSARADAGSATTGGWAWQYTDSLGELLSIVTQKIVLEIQAIGVYWDGPYNVMNSPMLTPLFALGFGIAVLMALRFPRRIIYWWSLLGLPIMLATDLISGAVVEIHSVRQSGVLTFTFILAGVGLADLWTWLESRFSKSIVSAILLVLAIVPTLISLNTYFNVFIPAGYANPVIGWRDEQIDVDLSKHILNNPDQSYLMSYEEYSRSNIAYLTAANYRNRHSAIDADGQLAIVNPPDEITVMIATDPYRIRHNGREAQWYQRAWVLLHDGQTYLLPPITAQQTATLLASIEDTIPEPYIDRSNTHIADFYMMETPQDLFSQRDVIDTALDATFSLSNGASPEVHLHGYTISQDDLSAGDTIFVTLYWQALQQTSEDYEVFVQILDEQGQVVGATHDFPYNGMYRSRIWETDEVTATHHWLKLSDELPVGRYTLRTGLYRMLYNEPLYVEGASANANHDAVLAQDLRVTAPLLDTDINPIDADIRFGDYLQLSGLELTTDDQPLDFGETWNLSINDTIHLIFDWTVLQRPNRDYSLFIHVTPADSPKPITQVDMALGINSYPTGAWRIGDRQQDQATLNLPPDMPSGEYDVWVGLYYYMDNTRLTPIIDDELSIDDRLLLGHINVN